MNDAEDVCGVSCLIILVHDTEWGDQELAERNSNGLRVAHACTAQRIVFYREADRKERS